MFLEIGSSNEGQEFVSSKCESYYSLELRFKVFESENIAYGFIEVVFFIIVRRPWCKIVHKAGSAGNYKFAFLFSRISGRTAT